MDDKEFLGLAYEMSEIHYDVVDEDCGCCTRVDVDGEMLFLVATPNKTELAAQLVGVSTAEMEIVLKMIAYAKELRK
jgi:hypothetical protein